MARHDSGEQCGWAYYSYCDYAAACGRAVTVATLRSFGHDPDNASRARIVWHTESSYGYANVIWANPYGHNIETRLLCTSGLSNGKEMCFASRGRWEGCSRSWQWCDASSDSSYTLSDASTTSVSFHGYMNFTGDWSENQEDFATMTETLPTNYRILPPTGLSGNVSNITLNSAQVHCDLTSWSANSNIGGTPYTRGGGRNWNFRVELKDNGTVVKTVTTNTQEVKSADFNLEYNFRLGKTYEVVITASNEFQQTVAYTTTLTVPFLGYVVTSASTKKIKAISVTEPLEQGGSVKFISRIKQIQ